MSDTIMLSRDWVQWDQVEIGQLYEDIGTIPLAPRVKLSEDEQRWDRFVYRLVVSDG